MDVSERISKLGQLLARTITPLYLKHKISIWNGWLGLFPNIHLMFGNSIQCPCPSKRCHYRAHSQQVHPLRNLQKVCYARLYYGTKWKAKRRRNGQNACGRPPHTYWFPQKLIQGSRKRWWRRNHRFTSPLTPQQARKNNMDATKLFGLKPLKTYFLIV